jgi:hypothetical protein
MRICDAATCVLALTACASSPAVGDGGALPPRDAAVDTGFADGAAPRSTRTTPLRCAPASGAPRDLLPVARLGADNTRVRLVWVREDQDGVQTLRDDDPRNGWVPAEGVTATLRIDLGPGLARPVALDGVALTADGALRDVRAYVLDACGGAVVAELPWADPSQPLALDGACGTCVEIDLRGGRDARVRSVALRSRDERVALPPALPTPPAAPPTPAHPESGVIEGFYGPPWSFDERARIIDAAARLGMGVYLYAPKDDPLHRSMWRVPYDAGFRARFTALGAVARARGVRVLFGVSPFLDYRDGDLGALVNKLRALLDAGADGVAILADDLGGESPDGAVGALHARVVTDALAALRETHPGVTMWFVPTIYDDTQLARAPRGADYLTALRPLPPAVRVLWTGRDTGSATLSGADLATVRGLLQRDPVIWDNAWANDAGDGFTGRVLFGTYEGRDDTLRAVTPGITANPLIQGSLARLTAGLLGAWLARGETGPAARAAAAELESHYLWRDDPGARDALLRLMEVYDGSFTTPITHRRLRDALGRVLRDAQTGTAPTAEDLTTTLDVFAGMSTLASTFHHGTFDAALVDELGYPLASLREEGLAGLALLDAITARLGGGDGADALARVRAHIAASGRAARFLGTGLLGEAARAAATIPRVDAGVRAPALPPAPRQCTPGASVTVDAPAGVRVRVYGAPATLPHAGRWDLVITASDPRGVASRAVTLVCAP